MPEGAEVKVQLVEKKPPAAPPAQSKSEQDPLAAALLEEDIVLTVPPKPTAEEIARFRAWKPIQMPGEGLKSGESESASMKEFL